MLNRMARRSIVALAFAGVVLSGLEAQGQTLRFGNHKEPVVPEDAILRIGPFYSSIAFSQSAGYRYTRSSGAGTDYIFSEHLGQVNEDGSEIPMISTLSFRNYMILSKHSDVDASVTVSYEHYPLGTQEDGFNVNLADEGMIGDLSSEFALSPFLKGTVYDSAIYKTDYVDIRGITDRYGGSRFRYFQNTVGLNLDWLMTEKENLLVSGSRRDLVPMDDEFKNQKGYFYIESAGYERSVTDYLILGLRADFGQNAYSDATNRPGSSTMMYSGTLGCKVTKFTMANAGLGYSMGTVDSDEFGDKKDSKAMVGNLGVQTKLSKQFSHSLQVSRSQQGGFESSLEISDTYGYNLAWNGDAASANLFSTLNKMDPQSTTINGYSDWMSGVGMKYPLTRVIALGLSSTYTVRKNDSRAAAQGGTVLPVSGVIDPVTLESSNDYNTWVSRVDTGFEVWRSAGKDAALNFNIYAEHADRDSKARELDYKRDVFGADLMLTKKF